MTVKVAIDLALDRLFTYEVPDAQKKKLAVGQLLSVPFGHRTARGFAVEIDDGVLGLGDRDTSSRDAQHRGDPDHQYKLKPIHAILDETPFFSATLLTLVRQIAAYTAAPLERVLQTALPAAVLKPTMHPKEQLFVEAVDFSSKYRNIEITKFQETEKPLTPKQQWLLDQIVRLGGGWMQQLCRELKTTPATLRTLESKGVVTIVSRMRRRDPLGGRRVLPSKPLPLNAEQRAALEMIVGTKDDLKLRNIEITKFQNQSQIVNRKIENSPPILLHGVTGSGKTEVYLQAIAVELAAGRGAIVLVPEIALTPQTVQRFASRFGERVAVLHSALSDGERYDEWHRIRDGDARVVIGPRSAVFAPVQNLGLIVVDEEHETSYKQEECPRYHARDAAVLRGKLEGAKVILGSATPSLETWLNAETGKYVRTTLAKRAGAGTLPFVTIVNMEEEGARDSSGSRGAIFSTRLLDAIQTRIDRAEQTILFLNRRGYSRSVICGACGHVLTCPDCSVSYTYHRVDSCCRCHVCGGWIPVPAVCPACGASAWAYQGMGTQRAEAALKKCFPRARILRMDADSTSRKQSHDDILGAFRRHEADILLGTQMIAKGLDFPNVTLVGVLNADSSLNLPDFRAGERTYQLLSQVAGRAGRAELPGEVYIQTYAPESPVIQAAARGDYAAFARDELTARRELGFPPFCHLSSVTLVGSDLKAVGDWAVMYAESLKKVKGLVVGEAVPCALEKAEGCYRWQIILRAQSVALTVKAWRWLLAERPPPKKLRVALDVDAFSLL